ncbi:MAG: N-acetylneuraminate synthase family protein [Bacteriovoracaceae bacterium]|nr:N-acetylneuraminate synthase family protein [Bacteriovoracaceae bacterium]
MRKTYIIAEIAQGYEGDVNLCKKYVKLAKKAGADGVKFQVVYAKDLCTDSYCYHNLYQNLEMPIDDWKEVINYSQEVGIDFWVDIFGIETFNLFKQESMAGIKLHCSDIKNYQFLSQLKTYEKKIIMAVGGSELIEIQKALQILSNRDVILMSGFQAEPNIPSDVELDKLEVLKEKFSCAVGYADHIDVSSDFSISLPAMAVLQGADYIEKHLTIERDELELEDYISALNAKEFRNMAALVRAVEGVTKTKKDYVLGKRELEYRKNTKKIPLAGSDLREGHTITADDICLLRTGEEVINILDIDTIIGKKLKCNLKKNKAFNLEFLK